MRSTPNRDRLECVAGQRSPGAVLRAVRDEVTESHLELGACDADNANCKSHLSTRGNPSLFDLVATVCFVRPDIPFSGDTTDDRGGDASSRSRGCDGNEQPGRIAANGQDGRGDDGDGPD